MKHIKKFNEGFLDIFKKRNDSKVSINNIEECLFDIEEDDRIISQLRGQFIQFYDPSDKKMFGREVKSDEVINIPKTEEGYPKFFVKNNTVVTKIIYDPSVISDEEVTEIINSCVGKLEGIYNCKVTYFISWMTGGPSPEGSQSDREWNNFEDMLGKTVIKYKKDYYNREIIIKIKPIGNLVS